ncbi:hypothetical protein Tco_1229556 [Tanacetum coccineum]
MKRQELTQTMLVDLDQQILEGLLHQRCMDVRIRHLRTANLTLSTGLKKKIEKYIRGFPEGIKGNVTSSKPATLHDAINMARELIEQRVQAKALRIGDSIKRTSRGCKAHHQPGPCPPRCGKCHKLGHQEGECRTRIPVAGGNSIQKCVMLWLWESWALTGVIARTLKNRN